MINDQITFNIRRCVLYFLAIFIFVSLQGCGVFNNPLRPLPKVDELESFQSQWDSENSIENKPSELQRIRRISAAHKIFLANAVAYLAIIDSSDSTLKVAQAPLARASLARSSEQLKNPGVLAGEFATNEASSNESTAERLLRFKIKLLTYRDNLYASAMERKKYQWEQVELSTYGGLASVVGGIASKVGLLNTGAGIAVLGLTSSSVYQLPAQSEIYLVAMKKIACINSRLNTISDNDLDNSLRSGDIAAQKAAINFFAATTAAVDAVRIQYTDALLGLNPAVISRGDLLSLVTTYTKQNDGVSESVSKILSENPAVFDEAGEKVKGALVDISICSKV